MEWFAGIAMVISFLGLFGLTLFTVEQRTKEISIRKLLGASLFNITQLLSRDLVKLVMVGLLIASPIAWWFMNKWLQDFAYRITIGVWIFLLGYGLVFLIALIPVCLQGIRAAAANPVKHLRSE